VITGWKSWKLIVAQTISPKGHQPTQGNMGKFWADRGGWAKRDVLEHKSGNISETHKDRGKLAMEHDGGPIGTRQRSFEWYHLLPIWPPLPQDWGFATLAQKYNLKFRANEC